MNLATIDYRLERLINAPAGHLPVVDTLMVAAASWAEVVFAAVVVVWFLFGMIRVSRREKLGAVTALLAAGGALLVNLVLSHLYFHSRPFVAHPGVVHLLLNHARDNSFPSDHAAGAFAVSVVLVAYRRRLGVVAIVASAWVAYARVYVGDHYPLDVLVGAADGIIAAILLLTILRVLPTVVAGAADHILVAVHLQPRRALDALVVKDSAQSTDLGEGEQGE
ncbi:MAG: phosphatase PAP2 family protein [Candidatus Dormibacteraceae bacterium]